MLNSFYLRFPSLVLHCYGPFPSLSVNFLPSKVSLNVQIQSPKELHWTTSLWTATGVQILVSITLHSDSVSFSSSRAATCCFIEDLPTQHSYIFSSHLCCLHTSQQIEKKLPFYKEWYSHLLYMENHCIIFSTVPTKACQLQLFLFSLTTGRTFINIKIISYIVMSNFYLKRFLWVIKIPLWM